MPNMNCICILKQTFIHPYCLYTDKPKTTKTKINIIIIQVKLKVIGELT